MVDYPLTNKFIPGSPVAPVVTPPGTFDDFGSTVEGAKARAIAARPAVAAEQAADSMHSLGDPLGSPGDATPGDKQPASAGAQHDALLSGSTGSGQLGDPAKVGGLPGNTLRPGPESPARNQSNVSPSNSLPAREAPHHGQSIGGTVPPGQQPPRPRPAASPVAAGPDAQTLAKRLFGR